jgi:menaquinone-dependent protoporphyrinogen oxidase
MSRILIAFASVDGQAFRIAERIASGLRRAGHEATLMRADAPGIAGAIEAHDAVVMGGAVRFGHHARYLERAVRENRTALDARPNALFSVSLSARATGAKAAAAQSYVDDFVRRTGWRPRATAIFAGALRYTHYNSVIRLLMRLISRSAGGETDTSRDYEYTDWQAVDRFAAQVAASHA